MTHSEIYLQEASRICQELPTDQIEAMVDRLAGIGLRRERLCLIGLGGSLANCQHAVSDFRRLCGIDAYTVDNLSTLTAAANDDGWHMIFDDAVSEADALFVLSVGGGTAQVSRPIVNALEKFLGPILGIVGRDGGETKALGDNVILVPTVHPDRVTPHTEAFQMVILHLLFSHPKLQTRKCVW